MTVRQILDRHLAQAAAAGKQPLADDITALMPHAGDPAALQHSLDERIRIVDKEQHQNAAVRSLITRGPEYQQAANLLDTRYHDLRRLENELKQAAN
jgi:hypothetical protein